MVMLVSIFTDSVITSKRTNKDYKADRGRQRKKNRKKSKLKKKRQGIWASKTVTPSEN